MFIVPSRHEFTWPIPEEFPVSYKITSLPARKPYPHFRFLCTNINPVLPNGMRP
eukprot:UN04227